MDKVSTGTVLDVWLNQLQFPPVSLTRRRVCGCVRVSMRRQYSLRYPCSAPMSHIDTDLIPSSTEIHADQPPVTMIQQKSLVEKMQLGSPSIKKQANE